MAASAAAAVSSADIFGAGVAGAKQKKAVVQRTQLTTFDTVAAKALDPWGVSVLMDAPSEELWRIVKKGRVFYSATAADKTARAWQQHQTPQVTLEVAQRAVKARHQAVPEQVKMVRETATAIWTEANFNRMHGHRGISLSVYQERMRAVNANGQPVQLELTSIGHGRDKLLVLLVDHSFPEFVHLCTSAYAEEELAKGNVYHISLCYEYEVYDWAVVDRVRSKFSGRRGVLHVHVKNSAAYLIQDGALSTSILKDYDIWSLNHYGFYGDRGLHMSL
jgi:hypothetical protein